MIQQRKSKECEDEREGKKERESEKTRKMHVTTDCCYSYVCFTFCKRMKRLRERISNGYIRKDIKWCENSACAEPTETKTKETNRVYAINVG